MKRKTKILIETTIGVILRLFLWSVVNVIISGIGDAAQSADNSLWLFVADISSLLAFIIFVYFVVKYIKRQREILNWADNCRSISENVHYYKYGKKIWICVAAMFAALAALAVVGVWAARANIDWLVEAADIAKIIVPLITILAITQIRKRQNKNSTV